MTHGQVCPLQHALFITLSKCNDRDPAAAGFGSIDFDRDEAKHCGKCYPSPELAIQSRQKSSGSTGHQRCRHMQVRRIEVGTAETTRVERGIIRASADAALTRA